MASVSNRVARGYDRRMSPAPVPDLFPEPRRALPESRSLLEAFGDARRSVPGHVTLVARGDLVTGAYLVEKALRVYYVFCRGREGIALLVEPGQSCILALNCMFSRLAYPAWVESEGDRSDDRPRRRLSAALSQRAGGAELPPSTCCRGVSSS